KIQKKEKLGKRPFFENVELRAGKPISGRVFLPNGEPAQGVKVQAYSAPEKPKDLMDYGSFANTRTDNQGRFHVMVITPGQGVFWILPADYAGSMHAVPDGQRGDMGTFTLEPGMRLRGKVLDKDGKPLARVNVGALNLEHLPPVSHGLQVVGSEILRAAVTN